jgi:hypothetical protein
LQDTAIDALIVVYAKPAPTRTGSNRVPFLT